MTTRPITTPPACHAVAIGFARGPGTGLAALDAPGTEPCPAAYPYADLARADFLRRLGRPAEAAAAFERAVYRTGNAVERDFLLARIAGLGAADGR
ncbi:RNA polymerase sigma-70 factor, ECF subfamily [Actinacidiphila alni]|uniref:RNA polymerase sigma-70 factor, ECF subfamily n=1 Tax=Actinacidiphila alni TaxID=380248 RepID=A0A1I2FZK4_9ACTN|nr:hypothetical protein [Actinacidiphila alni]SFF09861.1 RNA polymerase sigma-70 factor, ECF subfamily [Actinacidiphila alni]